MKYTPEKIAESDKFFSIPIYQRLFEWSTDNIVILLKDLKHSYLLSSDSDYYIGMLTSTEDNELVDGQQRFTVMMLLGCVFQEFAPEWKKFLSGSMQSRLRFLSRPHDDAYLQSLIDCVKEETLVYRNMKMRLGIKTIQTFLKDNIEKDNRFNKEEFAHYVFKHMVFFISKLPDKYNPMDLNRYFERMNTSGKNLEQHEILKVKLLGCLNEDINKYMQLWNLIAEVDVPLIRKRTYNNETEESFKGRKKIAFKIGIKELISSEIINGMNDDDITEATAIANVEISNVAPEIRRTIERDSHSALKFSYLLLNTLYWKLGGDIKGSIDDFFNPANMLSTFSQYLPYEGRGVNQAEISDFLQKLVIARLALDICFIRSTEYGYSLDMNSYEEDEGLQRLMMLESMIFVSSSNYTNYKWFVCLMESIKIHNGIPSVDDLYYDLKGHDDEEHKVIPPLEVLSYGEIRYWFWRLDYYIWEHRKELFKDNLEYLKVVENYVFTRNRSIEHVAPRKPETDSDLKWEETESDTKLMNSFGNLVMISQGLNSALKNKSFEVKYAHVLSYCNGSKTGSIESLKLLLLYKDYKEKKWTRDTILEHGHKMYELLLKSFER